MTDDFSPELQGELLDDFHSECDELFSTIRTHLSVLEKSGTGRERRREAKEALHRSIHTVKGNCSIVGLRPAEQLAHALEGALGGRNALTTPRAAWDHISRGLQRLEDIVVAHRRHQPLPEITDLLRALAEFSPAEPQNSPASAPASASLPPADEPQEPATGPPWQATFAPSPERNQRGVNVTSVRERLAALGTVTRAEPVIHRDGTMTFQFTLTIAGNPPTDLRAWEQDGIQLQPLTPEPRTVMFKTPADAARPPPPEAAVETPAVTPSQIVRVDLSRLDDLMRITAEMLIQRSRLEERLGSLPGAKRALQDVTLGFARSLRDLRAAITRVRLVPVAEIFSRVPYIVRDFERHSGKQVNLILEGEETEIDKYLVERLREPLLHLVRNALSHGVETAGRRTAAGKPERATVTLRAWSAGQTVVIEVRDDGAGIDPAIITERAGKLGLRIPKELTDATILTILIHSGFSTRESPDLAAGRGVGMTVVRDVVRELGGFLTLKTNPGEGTQFTLRLPLTLSVVDAVIVSAGKQTCAVPEAFIEEIIQIPSAAVRQIQATEVIPYRDALLPFVRLAATMGTVSPGRADLPILVIRGERGCAGLAVDRVHFRRELVVQPLQDPWLEAPGFTGAADLGDGRPVLVLDAVTLTGSAIRPDAKPSPRTGDQPPKRVTA